MSLPPAAAAFDAVAERFDARYGAWMSVASQRRAVRAALIEAFAPGAQLLEIGGGTGEDAAWLAGQGRTVLLTDVSPAMVRLATEKLRGLGLPTPRVVPAEGLEAIGDDAGAPFDGAFSNFAALNCVTDLAPVGRALATLVRPGGRVLIVLFGVCTPGEWMVELMRGNPRAAFRRVSRGSVAARVGGHDFAVRYHRGRDLVRALSPGFRLVGRRGIGVFVPPSAAEPWISRHPRLLRVLERLDGLVARPLALLGDHVLHEFERTALRRPEFGEGPAVTGRETRPVATLSSTELRRRFRAEYGAHRAAEGRALDRASLLQMPYLATGPYARQWAVRARTFDAFVDRVMTPMAHRLGRPLRVLDLGAGNGWLSWRAALAGHAAVAVDLRDDDVDGLGAAGAYLENDTVAFRRIVGSFDALPLASGGFDIVLFNASLHYALDLGVALREARRVTCPGGRVVILDSPFYGREADGERMVADKRRDAPSHFGSRTSALMSLPFIEYLTRDRLCAASSEPGLAWTRHRVRYPMWYELRPLVAQLRGQRAPSRFDLWEGRVT